VQRELLRSPEHVFSHSRVRPKPDALRLPDSSFDSSSRSKLEGRYDEASVPAGTFSVAQHTSPLPHAAADAQATLNPVEHV
jgi:hypothetical protein